MATLTTERPATIERPLEVESIPEIYWPVEEQDNESPGFWAGLRARFEVTPTGTLSTSLRRATGTNSGFNHGIDNQDNIRTLVIIAFKPEGGQRIASMVPNGRFHPVRNEGHYLQEDADEEIANSTVTILRDQANVTFA